MRLVFMLCETNTTQTIPSVVYICFHQEIFLPVGPLLPETCDVAMIPLGQRKELTINLSGETKHFVHTYYFIGQFVKLFPSY